MNNIDQFSVEEAIEEPVVLNDQKNYHSTG